MLVAVGDAPRALTVALAVIGVAWTAGSMRAAAPAAERLMTGLGIAAGAAWLVMAQPLLGVSALAHPWPVRAAVVAALAAVLLRRRLPPPRVDWRRLALPGIAAAVVS